MKKIFLSIAAAISILITSNFVLAGNFKVDSGINFKDELFSCNASPCSKFFERDVSLKGEEDILGASFLFPYQGGTGTSTAPSYGNILVGNSGGTYTLTSTSSLGLGITGQSMTDGSILYGLGGVSAELSSSTLNSILEIDSNGYPSWTKNLGDSSNRLGEIYVDTLRTQWLEVSANIIDSSLKIGSSTNSSSADLVFENTGGSGTLSLGLGNLFTLDKGITITGTASTTGLFTGQGGLDAGDNNITNVGDIALDTLSSDNGSSIIANTNQLVLLSSGLVGIGTTDPNSTFHVMSTSTVAGTIAEFGNADIDNGLQIINSDDASAEWGLNAFNNRNLVFQTNQTERLRIDSGGNVGIGTDSSALKLHVNDNSDGVKQVARFQSGNGSGSNEVTFIELTANSASDNGAQFATNSDGELALFVNATTPGTLGTEALRINGIGRVGIGTTNPLSKVHIQATTTTGSLLQFGNANTTGGLEVISSDEAGLEWGFNAMFSRNLVFQTNGTERMRINVSGNVGIGTTSPTTELSFGGAVPTISQATSDGADNAVLKLAGGGVASGARGAVIQLFGNENAAQGQLYLAPGTTGGAIYLNGNTGVSTTTPISKFHVDNSSGWGQITSSGSSGGCNMFRDTDDAGWTECFYLNGLQTCTTDADGICDGS